MAFLLPLSISTALLSTYYFVSDNHDFDFDLLKDEWKPTNNAHLRFVDWDDWDDKFERGLNNQTIRTPNPRPGHTTGGSSFQLRD